MTVAKKAPKKAATKKAVPDSLEIKKYDLTLTLLEPMLGTAALNPEVFKAHIESKKPEDEQEEEFKTVEAREERGTTGFCMDANGPFIYNYMIKGFLKHAGNKMKDQIGIQALGSKITAFVFVKPRRIRFDFDNAESAEDTAKSVGSGAKDARISETNGLVILERPLRANTPMGPRVALARSEIVPAGTVLKCVLKVLGGPIKEKVLLRILDYGEFQGLGQWRSADYGSFEYDLKEIV